MKVKNINELLENTIYNEVKNRLISEMEEKGKDYYHVMDGDNPIETFETYEDAEQYVMDNEKNKNGKKLLIDKKKYQSYDEMIDKLDEYTDKLTNNNINMKKKMNESQYNEYQDMDEDVIDKYMSDNEYNEYFPDEMADYYSEKEPDVSDVGSEYSEIDENADEPHQKIKPIHQFQKDLMSDKDYIEFKKNAIYQGKYGKRSYGVPDVTKDPYIKPMKKWSRVGRTADDLGDFEYTDTDDDLETLDMTEDKGLCTECGSMLNEDGMCSECGNKLYESKKKIRLSESELVAIIKKMVAESIPGLKTANKSREGSGKDTKKYYSDVEKKMKDYLNFDGNDNPEFPHQIGKGEKVARINTEEQDEEVAKNKAGLQNLEYDVEPSEKFKERMKMAIEGHSMMGNGVYTEKSKIKPSNGADKGKEAKEKMGNQIKTKTAQKIEKQTKDRTKEKEKRTLYKKEKVPVNTKSDKNINENKAAAPVINDIEKIKKLYSYNKKTQ